MKMGSTTSIGAIVMIKLGTIRENTMLPIK